MATFAASVAFLAMALLAGCRTQPGGSGTGLPELRVPRCDSPVAIDG